MIGIPFTSVWGTKMRLTLGIAALAATMAAATPAAAQTVASAQADARGTVIQPLSLARQNHLDFGTVVSTGTAGSVSINADTGLRSFTGGVTGIASTFNRATFTGLGTAGQTVSLVLTPPIGLVSGANNIPVTSMSVDSGGLTRTVPAGGSFTVGVGGTFAIAANQAPGLYVAQFDLTANYP
jgi:hypothetical protein